MIEFAESVKGKEERFYLLRTPVWTWEKSDGDDGGVPVYDHSEGGRLFMAKTECPACGGVIHVCAGMGCRENVNLMDWRCMACGIAGDIEAGHGQAQLTPRDGDDDVYYLLPECVVVLVEE